MKRRIPAPRILPLTIVVLAALLGMKSASLVRAATADRQDWIMLAGDHGAAKPKAEGGHSAPKPKPAHGEPAPHGAPPKAEPAAAPPAEPPGPPPISEAEKNVLLELRQRRDDLEARENALKANESLLTAAEQKLNSRVNELTTIQTRLETLEAGREQRADSGWQGLVKLYEAMKPRDAAVIFNDMAMPTLLQIMDRMKEAKAALVMSAMNPEKARDVTSGLAQMRLRREAPTGDDGAHAPVAAGIGSKKPPGS